MQTEFIGKEVRVAYEIRPDILLIDGYNRAVVVIEAKKGYAPEDDWAMEIAQKYAQTLGAKFALVVTPEWIQVWRAPGVHGRSDATWTIDARPLLAPLFKELGFDPVKVSGPGFEDLVGLWIQDLRTISRNKESLPASLNWLAESGLDDYLAETYMERGARFESVR